MGIRMNNPWIYIQLLKVVGFVNQSKKLTNNLRMPNADANLNDIGEGYQYPRRGMIESFCIMSELPYTLAKASVDSIGP
jgi:hypothetical protein